MRFFKWLLKREIEKKIVVVKSIEEETAKLRNHFFKMCDEKRNELELKKQAFLQEESKKPKFKVVLVTDLGEFDTEVFEPSVYLHVGEHIMMNHCYGYDYEFERFKYNMMCGPYVSYQENTSRKNAEHFAKGYENDGGYDYHHKKLDVIIPRKEIKLVKFIQVSEG